MTSDGVCARAEPSIDRAPEFITMRWREPVNTRSFFAALDQLDYDSAQEVFDHMLHWYAKHHQGHSIRAANVIRRGSLEPMLRL